jgi:adhesin/invasin
MVGANALSATVSGLAPASFSATGTTGPAAILAKSAGDAQATTVSTAVPIPPAVLVTDVNGNPVSGVAITFAVTAGGGSLTGATPTTNASGIASVGSWTLGPTAGVSNNTLTASATGLTSVTFTATANSGSADEILLSAGNGQTGTVGSTLGTALSVLVEDATNNPVVGFGVSWSAGAGGSVNCGGGPVPSCTATTNGSGISSATWTLGPAAGAQQATGSAGGLTGSPVTFNATANAGAAASIVISAGNNQSAAVNTAVATAPAVLVTDAFGNPVGGVNVTFAVASGGGTITGGSQTSNGSGIATVGSWTLGTTVGSNTLTATSAGLTGSPQTFTATATAGAAASVAISAGNGQSATVGTAVATDPTVLVTDQFGNPVAGATVTFAVASGGGSVTGGSQVSNAGGIATVASWTLGPVAGSNTLTATVGALPAATFTATGTAGAAANVARNTGNNQTATVNTAVAIAPSVLVTDANGNPVAGVTVTFAVTGGAGSLTGATPATNGAGIATLGSWTLGTAAGANSISATVASVGSVTFNATSTAGAAASIVLSTGNGQTAAAGSAVAVNPAVLVSDQFGNPVAGTAVTFAVTAGGGSVTGGSTTSNASGIAMVGSWTLGPTAGAGNNGLNATSAGLAGSPVTFTASATAGAAATVAVSAGDGQSATVAAAVAVDPAVVVTDAFGNVVSGVSVTFAVASGGGSVTGANQVTNASGVATVNSWTLGNTAGANSLTATVSGLTPAAFTATGTAGAATQVAINAGDNQTATVNTAVATNPSVIVLDAFNNPVPGVTVAFTVTGGGGTRTGGNPSTNASGLAQVGSWTLGTAAGANTLSATVAGVGSVTFNATGTAGAATTMALNAGDNQTATVNTAVSVAPSVIVRDAFNNPVPGVTVSFTVTGGGGSRTGGNPSTNASGVAQVGSWTLGTAAGTANNTLSAASTGLTGSPVTFTASATADVASDIALSAGDGQSATVGTAVAVPPSVLVTDQFGNPVGGTAVSFAVSAGGGNVSGANQTTNAAGIATVGSWTLGATAGGNQLDATSGGLNGSPVKITATGTAGAATAIARNAGNNQTATVNTAVATPPSVIITDAFGNPVSGVAVTFAVTSGSGSITGANQTSNASGIATVGSWTMGTVAGGNSLSATASVGSVTFNATGTAGTPTQIAINAGNGQTATVNTAVATDPSVILRDAFNNVVSGATVTFAVTGGGGSVTGGSQITNASGIATVTSWTLGTTAGANALSATNASAGSVGFTATGNAGAATQIAVSAGNGQTTTVNTAVPVDPAVLVRDAFNNPVSGVGVTFAVTAGGGSATGTSQTTNASGIATVTSWTVGTVAGTSNNTLTATSSGLSGSPVSFTASATAGAATQIALNAGNGQTATVNTAVATDPSVIVRDAFNNVKSGVSVTFAVTSGGGSATGTAQTTNASGIATVTSWTLGTVTGTNTMTATSTGLSGSPVTFTATGNPGPADHFVANAGGGQTVRPGTLAPTDPQVTVHDVFHNPVPNVSVTFTVSGGTGTVTCVLFATSSCSETANASGVATLSPGWTFSASGVPTTIAPAGGTYTNSLSITSGSATALTMTGTARWSFASDVAPLFTANSSGSCNGCHTVGNFGTYSNTVNRATVDNPGCGTIVVTTGSLANSVLYQKINHTPPCGGNMPQGGAQLPSSERFIIRDWILNNAPNN